MRTLGIVTLALATSFAFGAKPHVYKGWVGDAACGVKCASPSHMACAISCLKNGGTYIFVLNNKAKTIYTVDNPAALKGHEGHLVQVTAVITGKNIHVDAVKMLKQPVVAAQTGEH